MVVDNGNIYMPETHINIVHLTIICPSAVDLL